MVAVTTEPVIVGNLRIPAENFAEWEHLNNEAHDLMVAGEPIPQEMAVRLYVLEGASEAVAELVASIPHGCEEHDCHAVD
jgi:hypothetical protein